MCYGYSDYDRRENGEDRPMEWQDEETILIDQEDEQQKEEENGDGYGRHQWHG